MLIYSYFSNVQYYKPDPISHKLPFKKFRINYFSNNASDMPLHAMYYINIP